MKSESDHNPLLTVTSSGLYCADADVYLDPWRPVHKALITHAHSDHARPGSTHYLTHKVSVPLLHLRLGTTPEQVEGVEYREVLTIRGVKFSFHPAGHVPGSAQILVERGGERWVFSGDYKTESDGVSTPFDPVRCDTFISECTFGLPVFKWRPQKEVFEDINRWWANNIASNCSSVLCAYSLGKAQRVLAHLDRSIGRIAVHPSVWTICQALGFPLDGIERASSEKSLSVPMLVVAPPAVIGSTWLNRFGDYQTASVSGWMAIRGIQRRRGVDRGFVLSDHADFEGLTNAISQTGASRVFLTHGYTAQFAKWLSESGTEVEATELQSQYSDDLEE